MTKGMANFRGSQRPAQQSKTLCLCRNEDRKRGLSPVGRVFVLKEPENNTEEFVFETPIYVSMQEEFSMPLE
jgi:hypothetical protein